LIDIESYHSTSESDAKLKLGREQRLQQDKYSIK